MDRGSWNWYLSLGPYPAGSKQHFPWQAPNSWQSFSNCGHFLLELDKMQIPCPTWSTQIIPISRIRLGNLYVLMFPRCFLDTPKFESYIREASLADPQMVPGTIFSILMKDGFWRFLQEKSQGGRKGQKRQAGREKEGRKSEGTESRDVAKSYILGSTDGGALGDFLLSSISLQHLKDSFRTVWLWATSKM